MATITSAFFNKTLNAGSNDANGTASALTAR